MIELTEETQKIYRLLAKIYVWSKERERRLTLPELVAIFEEVYGSRLKDDILGDYIKKEERSLR